MIAISRTAGLALTLLLCAGRAQASVEISSAPTMNMSCSAGVCTPTAKSAVLNVNDLTAMLSSADIAVKSGNSAVTIGIVSPFAWASTHRLTLDANLNVNIRAQVMVEGTAGLTIVTNDGGNGGDLMIYPSGKIDFWDTNSSLIINGNSYVLVSDLKTLATDLHAAKHGEGFFALANDFDADHKNFKSLPIVTFNGTFEGLGNGVANLDIARSRKGCEGMFASAGEWVPIHTLIRDFNLKNVHVNAAPSAFAVGPLVGCSRATIINVSADGTMSSVRGDVGGLVGGNAGGPIIRSHSTISVQSTSDYAGGLVGFGGGPIDQSYATENVAGPGVGGVIGFSYGGVITNSYASGVVTSGGQFPSGGFAGGTKADVSSSYSTGAVTGPGTLGGFAGSDNSPDGMVSTYWDLDTSGISDPSRGAGNIADDPGITGLTDAQLKSGLPAGFDPKIWAQSAAINNGYPYLIANPPQ